jgi:anti-sigma regulatory factor (Ser/Thr protein kinase)
MARSTDTYPCERASVTRARHAMVAFLDDVGCADRDPGTAALLVSELAANAVLHAHSPFTVDMHHADGTLEVEVGDDDPTVPALRTPDDEGGRGLRVVDALAGEWGTRSRDPGKSVYFRLDC